MYHVSMYSYVHNNKILILPAASIPQIRCLLKNCNDFGEYTYVSGVCVRYTVPGKNPNGH